MDRTPEQALHASGCRRARPAGLSQSVHARRASPALPGGETGRLRAYRAHGTIHRDRAGRTLQGRAGRRRCAQAARRHGRLPLRLELLGRASLHGGEISRLQRHRHRRLHARQPGHHGHEFPRLLSRHPPGRQPRPTRYARPQRADRLRRRHRDARRPDPRRLRRHRRRAFGDRPQGAGKRGGKGAAARMSSARRSPRACRVPKHSNAMGSCRLQSGARPTSHINQASRERERPEESALDFILHAKSMAVSFFMRSRGRFPPVAHAPGSLG